MDEHIDLLKQKLRLIYQGEAFDGKPTKIARSHGKRCPVSIKQETSRMLLSSLFILKNAFLVSVKTLVKISFSYIIDMIV